MLLRATDLRSSRQVLSLLGEDQASRLAAELKPAADRLLRADPRRGLRVAQSAARLAKVRSDEALQAAALWVRADALREMGRHRQAVISYGQAAARFEAIGQPAKAAATAVGRLDSLVNLTWFSDADAVHAAAKQAFVESRLDLEAAKLDANYAILLRRRDKFEEALNQADAARLVFVRLEQPSLVAQIDINRANLLTDLSRYDEAESTYLRARDSFQQLGQAATVAMIDANLAGLDAIMGRYHRSLERFTRAGQAFAELGIPKNEAKVELDATTVLLALNLPAEASKRASSARELFSRLGLRREAARALVAEGLAAADLDDSVAKSKLMEARRELASEGSTSWVASIDLHLAAIACRRGEPLAESALNLARQAAGVFRRAGQATRLAEANLLLGRLSELAGDRNAAFRYVRRVARAAIQLGLPALEYQAHHSLGRLLAAQRPAKALQHYRSAVAAIERLRGGLRVDELRATFVTNKAEVYEDLVRLLLDTATTAEAFEAVEAAKSRALLDVMVGETSVAEAGLTPETRRLDQIRRELDRLYGRFASDHDSGRELAISRLEAEAALLRRQQSLTATPEPARSVENVHVGGARADKLVEIGQFREKVSPPADSTKSPDRHSNTPATFTAKAIAEMLGERTLVEFFGLGDELLAFVVDGSGQTVHRRIGSVSETMDLVHRLRFQIAKFQLGPDYVARQAAGLLAATESCLRNLYDRLLRPVESRIRERDLIVVPHGPLHYVPFSALHDGKEYLVATRSLSIAPSAAVLATCLKRSYAVGQRATTSPPRIAALAVPDDYAPAVEGEVIQVAAEFDEAAIYVGQSATSGSLRHALATADFVHLATHGVFARENPLFSRLLLADGWLAVHDISAMPSNATLVTVSACETGVQRVASGDELLGLARGFFASGTPSLVVSLWTVNDAATAYLMTAFYRELRAGNGPAQALAIAQRRTAASYLHPYYWAPFVLLGSPGWAESTLPA